MSATTGSAGNHGAGDAARRTPAVLVVDDEADLRELFALTLVRLGLDVDGAESLAAARALLERSRYALVLTDMRLPDGTGLDLVRDVSQGKWREAPPIAVITAYGSAENAVAALKAGAFDYLTKPVDLEQLRLLVRSALREGPGRHGRTDSGSVRAPALARLLGASSQMQQLRAMIERLGHSMAPVAIRGESGSGKELVARAIHECSARHAAPFVAVNCGAIPEALMEAEFFGYRRGAFTGAERDRDGFFQAAAGGTLFLDEVADLPLPMQVKLLRAIQEKHVRRVGATAEEPVNVRIICATHQDLRRLMDAGRFRQDLFFRIHVIEIRMPALRECGADIAALAIRILARLSGVSGAAAPEIAPQAIAALKTYDFPGNVRELENILERALALHSGGVIGIDDLQLQPPKVGAGETAGIGAKPLQEFLDDQERQAILDALQKTRFNRTAAARILGVTFRSLRYRMERLGLNEPEA